MMHSGGGIMRLASAVKRAASLVESGPAAGVIACARLAREEHLRTSSPSTWAARPRRRRSSKTASLRARSNTKSEPGSICRRKLVKGGGYPIKMPFIDVSEIGAGGGSLIALDRHGHVSVGPQSAGCLSRAGLLSLRRHPGDAHGRLRDPRLHQRHRAGGRFASRSTPRPPAPPLPTRLRRPSGSIRGVPPGAC